MASTPVPAWAIALACVLGALLLLLVVSAATRVPTFRFHGKTVLITGGSSGIGKEVARGAHVALFARRMQVLEAAKAELEGAKKSASQVISIHSVDVSSEAAVAAGVAAAAAAHGGVIDAIVASAGVSQPRRFEECSSEEFLDVYKTNVLGCRNVVRAVLPYMHGMDGGRIVLVSSQAGQVGIYGYTAYSASKFALNGFAQALQHELLTRNIYVSLSFPPDTDTPMLATENLQKPHVTRLLSESTSMVHPRVVGESIINGMRNWQSLITVGLDGKLLAMVTSGFSPVPTLAEGALHIFMAPIAKLVSYVFMAYFSFTIRRNDKPAAAAGASSSAPLKAPLMQAAGGGVPRASLAEDAKTR